MILPDGVTGRSEDNSQEDQPILIDLKAGFTGIERAVLNSVCGTEGTNRPGRPDGYERKT